MKKMEVIVLTYDTKRPNKHFWDYNDHCYFWVLVYIA